MDIVTLREYCLSHPFVEEAFPFDESTLVFKVFNKIFLLVSIHSSPLSFNVKCNPELAVELRETYTQVKPGYHMNKKHWNTVEDDGRIDEKQLKNWIYHSYQLVVNSLPKKLKNQII